MKKILSIIAISLLGVIALAVVALAFIPKQFDVKISAPDSIIIYKTGTSMGETYLAGTDEYNQIYADYLKGFNSTLLGSLFQGKLFANVSIAEGYKNLDQTSLTTGGDTYLCFHYGTTQTLTFNGNEYDGNYDNDYYNVVFKVSNSSILSQVTAYISYGNTSYSYYRFNTYATQSALYDYLNSITE